MTALDRRRLLQLSGAALAMSMLRSHQAMAAPIDLAVERRSLDILRRPASVFAIRRSDGRPGIVLSAGERFQVRLANRIDEPTMIHWHGQTPPIAQDGVPDLSGPPIQPGATADYDFAARPGTHWMHSHHGLQELQLMAAPLIVHEPADRRADRQEVVVLLHDFSFRPPQEILASLTTAQDSGHLGHHPPAQAAPAHGTGPAAGPMDLNDFAFDAYLANDRTLDDPEVVRIERRGRVLLRLINGAAATVFYIDLGELNGSLVAVDGNPIRPIAGRRFGMAMGQRLDIRLDLPAGRSSWPILAQREGDRVRTGIILAPADAAVARVPAQAARPAAAFGIELEAGLRAVQPLRARPPARRHRIALTGSMSPYAWTIDGKPWGQHEPMVVRRGERIELEMVNRSDMAHPMHLHGHHFQVVAVNGRTIAGAMRDTVHVPRNGSVRVAFDADNPGRWLLHCHNLLHMATGMMTEFRIEG